MSHSLKPISKDSDFNFPHQEMIDLEFGKVSYKDALEKITPLLTGERKEKIDRVIKGRTYSLIPFLENIYDMGNMSAVIRTAESFGFQSLHVEPAAKMKKERSVSIGSDKWLDYIQWEDSAQGLKTLQSQGYQVIATTLSNRSVPLSTIDLTKPSVLVMGNEKDGVSPKVQEIADHHAVIPMSGFSQSFNISVATALCLYEAHKQRVSKFGQVGDLTQLQQDILKSRYYIQSVKNVQTLQNLFK